MSLCCYYDSPSLPLYSDYFSFTHHVHYVAACCSTTTASVQPLGLETSGATTGWCATTVAKQAATTGLPWTTTTT